jgi:uncharacterized membrane protein YozB (DUF420 family)
MTQTSQTLPRRSGTVLRWTTIFLLILIVLAFFVLRLIIDVPHLLSGTLPDPTSFDYRYTAYAWLAYAHIVPGIIYLVLAPLQLWRGFRNRHIRWHRRIGRVALTCGVVGGALAIVFGLFFSFGGPVEAAASVVFGVYFTASLVLAYRAIRSGDVTHHRHWMIRAFSVGLGVGTVRVWIALFQAFELFSFRDSFGIAFWISFTLHVIAAELWLRWRPAQDSRPAARRSVKEYPRPAV